MKTFLLGKKRFKIMDTLPVLPGKPVKEGDSWPVAFNVKIEGLTDVIRLQGMSRLDSFEWQNGIECAKIVSEGLIGSAKLSLAGGKIRSSADTVTAKSC